MFTIEIVYFNFNIRKYQKEYVSHKDICTLKVKLESKLKELKYKGFTYSYDYKHCENRFLHPH